MPNVGDTLALSLQLFDSATDKFVRGTLRDDAGADLGASPASLTHDSNGNYTNSTVTMPAGTDYVTVTYEVFDDALFTTPSADHGSAIDTFDLSIPSSEILDCLTTIKDALDALELIVNGIAQVGDVLAVVTDGDPLVATVSDDQVIARVLDEDTQQSVVATDEPTGLNLSDEDQIISTVECD